MFHVITNFSALDGAQTMLARLLHVWPDEHVIVASLIDVSERARKLVNNSRVVYHPLQARTPFALLSATMVLARLIREHQPRVVLCWMYHAMLIGLLACRIA